MYTPLDINRENLTIMGIEFPDLKSLESAANAIGSNMFEGFEPTSELGTINGDIELLSHLIFEQINNSNLKQ
ncbi:MAG: hypothetical protein NWS89_07550 [Flavobacteriales bacterium]|jgi:hypothetical protein|nr:hypothetical protein [Flavobacteriales bacterium]